MPKFRTNFRGQVFDTRVSVQVEIPMSGSNASTAENRKLDTNSTEATQEVWDSRTIEAQLWPDTNNLTGPLLGARHLQAGYS